MDNQLHERLMQAKERKFKLNKAERTREELLKRRKTQERLLVELEMKLEAEQADVEQLTRMTLTNLFHTIFRSKEERLELERQQAFAAAVAFQEAREELASIEADLMAVGEDLSNYRDAEREYEILLREKEAALQQSQAASAELGDMEDRIMEQAVLVKEVNEAWTAGKRVLSSLEIASDSLEKAENWGKWDLWGGGGLISTHQKHEHVNGAKTYIRNANHLMRNFRDELDDLKRSVDVRIDIGDVLKMADYWFDGFFVDWAVQGRIQNAQNQVLRAIHQVRSIVKQLGSEHTAAEAKLAALQSDRIAWIEREA